MCDFCEGKTHLEHRCLKAKISNDVPFFKHALSIYDINICPPFADCSGKDVKREIHFQIRFCPMCGKKLEG